MHVINYDLPNNIEDYVHRIGRTGRAGHEGLATAFISSSDGQILTDLRDLLVQSNQEVPDWFENLIRPRGSGGGGRGGGRGKGGQGKFGGRDFRHKDGKGGNNGRNDDERREGWGHSGGGNGWGGSSGQYY